MEIDFAYLQVFVGNYYLQRIKPLWKIRNAKNEFVARFSACAKSCGYSDTPKDDEALTAEFDSIELEYLSLVNNICSNRITIS